MAQQLVSAIGVMVAGVFACAAYYWLSDKALQAIFPVRSGDVLHASRNLN
ncbi:alpha-glucoside ABC transporter permease, partial [Mesorhizobium sp. M8A.F.Ca.ET.161.01.1.1]